MVTGATVSSARTLTSARNHQTFAVKGVAATPKETLIAHALMGIVRRHLLRNVWILTSVTNHVVIYSAMEQVKFARILMEVTHALVSSLKNLKIF